MEITLMVYLYKEVKSDGRIINYVSHEDDWGVMDRFTYIGKKEVSFTVNADAIKGISAEFAETLRIRLEEMKKENRAKELSVEAAIQNLLALPAPEAA